ncbi:MULTISPECIES: hypothetical protein [unclassified Nocardioides]|uniref:hypothetical protein n=1 Tax=unclassified Nocardioides TaxID=2615069 RepID=UPI0026670BE9|nr:hypothetical protein [Nocardioides sp. Arc9.136]WKN49195.1 hypothetical protein OSR43_03450 [Nocardioides sp. Arc9.136]
MSVQRSAPKPGGTSVGAAGVGLVVTLLVFVVVFVTFLVAPLVALLLAFLVYTVMRPRSGRTPAAPALTAGADAGAQPPAAHGFGAGAR